MNYFSEDELKCSHTGESKMDEEFMVKINTIRKVCDFPFTVTSAYRHPTHPIEARKAKPGSHASGRAIDIAVRNEKAHKLIEVALANGITGIGVAQKGGSRFIHLDDLDAASGYSRPTVWSY
tara:strand:- start:929 stop:1294 length:366 start_codon:yes stop_codon:yes gene_type:complete